MITYNIFSKVYFSNKFPSICITRKFSEQLQLTTVPSCQESSDDKTESLGEKKLVRVAVLGRPNAGKSTFINRVLGLNVCDVSCRTHTTRHSLKTALIRGNTQILFVDTPGLVTDREYRSFGLGKTFRKWRESTFKTADVFAVVHYSDTVGTQLKFQRILMSCLEQVPESRPTVLILNKIDLIKKKIDLLKLTTKYLNESNVVIDGKKFAKVFLTSALTGDGVENVVEYFLSRARPGDWVLGPDQKYSLPEHRLICNLVRGKMLDILPETVPYKCKYEVEYLKEDDLGRLVCVVLVTCENRRHEFIIIKKSKDNLRIICKQLESDFFHIFGKTFHLKIVVVRKNQAPPH